MNWFCKTFGHKFIANIYDGHPESMKYRTTSVEIMCKRCGLTREEIAKANPKGD